MKVTRSEPGRKGSRKFSTHSKKVKSYANDPLIIKKANKAEELLMKYGLPNQPLNKTT